MTDRAITLTRYKKDWGAAKIKWTNYWKHQNTGRPLMCVITRRPEVEYFSDGMPIEGDNRNIICQGIYYDLPENLKWKDMEDKYQDAERMVARYHQFCRTHEFLGEAFPNLPIDFGPGSLAAYLGCDIGFNEDTTWFIPCLDDWEDVPDFCFDPENAWFKKHIELARACRELAGDDFYVDMPDLMENIDVLSSLRGAQDFMVDLAIDPDEIKRRVGQITDLYYDYYDRFYDIVKDENGGNAYTVFQVWGPGRTVKLQCDSSAMIGPDMFRDTILDSLKEQASHADQVLYHLDGKECIRHMDALMEVDGIDALQWTPGDAGPDGTLKDWDVIYDKAAAAGKSLWVKVYSGGFEDWIRNCDRLVNKYGTQGLFFLFPEMSHDMGHRLMDYAETHWK